MSDRADQIAREIAADVTYRADIDWLEPEIAAALRSYAAAEVNAKLEEAAERISDTGDDICSRIIRSLKSPDSKEPQTP